MVLVTGASGFIGKHVVEELVRDKQTVVCLVRNKNKYSFVGDEEVLECDLSDIELLKQTLKNREIDTCIHLAWEGIPDYSYEYSKKNLEMGMNVLEICKDLNISKLIITGSCWEYASPKGAISTSYRVEYNNCFKAAKNSLHMMAHAFCNDNDIKLNWLRLFYVYGVGQREGSLIPHIIQSFKEGHQPELNGAYNENDFVNVRDVAKVIVEVAMCNERKEVLNVGMGEAVRVLDVVEEVAKQMDFTLDKEKYIFKEGASFYADKAEMIKDGIKCEISIRDGIKEMLEV